MRLTWFMIWCGSDQTEKQIWFFYILNITSGEQKMQSQAASQPCPVLFTDTRLRPSQRDPENKEWDFSKAFRSVGTQQSLDSLCKSGHPSLGLWTDMIIPELINGEIRFLLSWIDAFSHEGTARGKGWALEQRCRDTGVTEMAYFMVRVIHMSRTFLRHFQPFLADVLKTITRTWRLFIRVRAAK